MAEGRIPNTAIAALGACLAMAIVGCTRVADGTPNFSPDQRPKPVAADEIDQLVVDSGQLVDIVGVQMRTKFDKSEPLSDDTIGRCENLGAAGQAAHIGDDWQAFRFRLSSDRQGDGDVDHLVVQAVAVYPDVQSAMRIFGSNSEAAQQCNQVTAPVGDANWTYAVEGANADTIRWRSMQVGVRNWRCVGEARVRTNVLIRVQTCRSDQDPGRDTDVIVSRIGDTVWKLSAPTGAR